MKNLKTGVNQTLESNTALVEIIRHLELAATEHIVNHAVAAAREESSPDLILITVDGKRRGIEDVLAMVAAQDGISHDSARSGPMEALILGAEAVLLTYPIRAEMTVEEVQQTAYEQASVLWVRRAGKWQNVWTHATTILNPEPFDTDSTLLGQVVRIVDLNADVVGEVDVTVLAVRRQQAIACEQAAVETLRQHDLQAAMAAVRADCLLVEADGSRQGREAWLKIVADPRRTLSLTDFSPIEVVVVSPTVMMVVYTMTSVGSYDGSPFHFTEALSALWIQQNGEWQCAFMQVTMKPSSEAVS